MTQAVAEFSMRGKARIAGAIYLFIIIAGMFIAGYVPSELVVPGDVAATASRVLAQETLWRAGLVVHVLIALANVPLSALFYDLFGQANKTLARMVIFFILVAVTIEAVNLLTQFAALALLEGEPTLSVVPSDTLQAQAYFLLRFQATGFNLSLAFVGCYCVTAGYLVIRSRLMSRVVGVLLLTGGLCYVVNAFASFLSPEFASSLFPYILIPSFFGEASLCLWLLVFGKHFEMGEAV